MLRPYSKVKSAGAEGVNSPRTASLSASASAFRSESTSGLAATETTASMRESPSSDNRWGENGMSPHQQTEWCAGASAGDVQ